MDQIQTVDSTLISDHPPEEESSPVENTTLQERKSHQKWQRLLSRISWQPTTTDAVNFFNRPLGVHYSQDDEEDSLGQSTQDVRLAIDDGPSHLSTKYQPAFYYPTSWTGLVTIPSQIPVSLEEKMEDVTQLWSPEEDGLYVGHPPKCARRRWQILERRLVTHAADKAIKSKWFRTDGSVSVQPDPLRPYLVRNIIPTREPRPVYQTNGQLESDGSTVQQLDQAYPLHLLVSRLFFDHHWLFGKENVLAGRLCRQWQLYSTDGTDGIDHPSAAKLDVLARKLRALYQAHDEAVDLLDRLQFNGAHQAVMAAQFQRITSYRQAIGWTRGDYYTANGRRLASIRSMVADWKELKALRKSQGFASTSCKLVVRKMTSGPSTAHLDWHEEIERQMDESRRLFQEHVRADIDRYQRQKAQWKQARNTKPSHDKDTNNKSTSSADDSQPENDGESKKTHHQLHGDQEPPEAPPDRHFDEVQTRADIIRVMQESLTPPGDKIVQLSWSTIPLTSASNNAREQRRIEAIKKCVYQLRILINQQEASVSDVFHLTEEFKADQIQQAFHLWIRDKPRNITIQLFYKNSSSHKKWLHVADVPVTIPSPRTSFTNQPESQLKFQSALVLPAVADLASVGCGVKQDDIPPTNGVIVLKTGWGTDANGSVLSPNIHQPTLASNPNQSTTDCINLFQLDPNDPANAEMLDKIEKIKRMEWRASNGNKSSGQEIQEDTTDTFCPAEQLDSNIRFQLLRRRADQVKPFGHLTMVPTRAEEIPNHLTQILNASGATGSSFQPDEDQENINPLDLVRRRGQRKWLQMYPTVADRLSSTSQKRLQLADLVMEDHIQDMSTFGGQLMPVLFKAHRPLRPERKERNPVPLLAGLAIHTSEQISLRVNIIRALNLPHKIDSSDLVHPFVQVSFQKSSARTTAGNGSSPTWNQELVLPVNFQDGVRSLAYLQSIRDDLFIQLFDEVVIDILDDDRQRDVSLHQRYERHWLGGFKIPFQVVYKWSKIEGTFGLNIPLVPIGYQYNHLNHDGPLLTVLISISPAVSPPRANQDNGTSMEDQTLVDYVTGWRTSLLKEMPSLAGLINPLVVNQQALTVYVGRYLTRLEPPEQLLATTDQETLRNLCQFVAAIPSASSNQPALLPRIWLTCQTVLDWLVGGDEERAVLLHNYMAALEYEVYILLGMAVPEGETAYVLYRDKTSQSMRMINPSTGLMTNVTDPTSPMQQVWVIFNQNDFWVNVHQKVHPSQLEYQVAKSSDWRPLFSRRFPNPRLASVQKPECLLYPATNLKHVAQLEESIIDHLKQSFMKWRKTIRTKWNRHAGLVFRDILEQAAKGVVSPTSNNLQELLESYKVFGVPLKTAYVNLEGLSDLLYATGLHRHQGIEFALSVYIKPYPNHLFHVFVFGAYLENL